MHNNIFLSNMGQGQYQHTHPVLDNNWVTVRDTTSLFSHVNPYASRTLRNNHNHQQIEEYLIEFTSEYEFRHYAQELRVRIEPSNNHIIQQNSPDSYYNLSPYIYTVKYFVNNTLQDMCSTVYKGLLYAQKVDLRLKEINDIPLSDQLYLTKATLEGFKLLYEKVGYFDITEEMIFISKEGKVKVWINCNISKNEPLFIPNVNAASRNAHGSQSDMLVQLLDLIEQNSDEQEQQGIHFKQYLTKKGIYNRLSFHRALDQFEAYCMQEHMYVENCMKSIYDLYHEDQPEHSFVIEHSVDRVNNERTTMNRQSEYKLRNEASAINQISAEQLHLPIPERGNEQLIGSRVSKQSQRQPRSIFNVERRQDTNRARSTNNYTDKVREISFHTSNIPTFRHLEPTPIIQIPNHQNYTLHLAHIPQPNRSVNPSLPAVGFRLPPNNTRPQHVLKVENAKPAVIKFNYVPNQNLEKSRHSQLENKPKDQPVHLNPFNLVTVKSIKLDSSSTGQKYDFGSQEQRKKNKANSINYYSSDQTYTLDREIAQDLQKFLGYNLNT